VSASLHAADAAPRPRHPYLRLLAYIRPYRLRLAVGVVFGLAFAGANVCLVGLIKGDVGPFKGGFLDFFRIESASAGTTLLFALAFPLVAFVRGLCDYVAHTRVQWVGYRVVMDLRNAVFARLHDLPVAYFSRQRTGELISRTTNDTGMLERAVSTVVTDLVKQPPTLVGMLAWVFWLDARLAVVSMVVFPVCLWPILTFGRRARRNTSLAQQRIADVVAILQESITGVRIVKAFGMEDHENARFRAQTASFFGRVMRVARANIVIEPIIVLIASVGISAILVYVSATGMSLERFLAFALAMFLMYDPVKRLSKLYVTIEQSRASAERVFEILDTPATVSDAPAARDFTGPIRRIRFENVSFCYDDEAVIRDVAFDVAAGERIALVGPSGAGKTTLVNLLPRFYDVTSGRILLNDRDLRDYTLRSLRSQIGLVTQETFLFNETIAANIAYGSPAATRDRIEEASRQAQAHDFVTALPQGYETVVGERGVRLSGGQRQRLAIARAILRNPPILILDEATSALDTESERLVQAALESAMGGRTVFAIAHRLSTITRCNRILVLDSGRIVESGTHSELLAAGGLYRRLYDLQFEMSVAPAEGSGA
jgi:subfamily B ATP-binding cassette protein MsbA